MAGTRPPRVGPERAHPAQQLVAVDVGHPDVADQHVRTLGFDEADRFVRRRRRQHDRRRSPRGRARSDRARRADRRRPAPSRPASSSARDRSRARRHRRAARRRSRLPPTPCRTVSGRWTVTVVPLPSPALFTPTVPPCSSTRLLTSDRPSPSPPCLRVVEASPWRKRSNRCGMNAGWMPMPVSATAISTCASSRCEHDLHVPPRGVNLMAFDSRFQTTCCRRPGSPEIGPAAGSRMRSTRMPLASAAGVTVSIAASMNESGCSGCMSSRSLPEMMRLMSSRSSMSCVWTRALRSIVSRPARSSSALRAGEAQHLRPAEDGVQRRAQLVRQRGQELVLGTRSCARPRRGRRARCRAAPCAPRRRAAPARRGGRCRWRRRPGRRRRAPAARRAR